ANALFCGRPFVNTDDVRAACFPVLCHRLVSNYSAISEGITTVHIVQKILDTIAAPSVKG
ncbi:MAG: AAA family ATPase, partial [Planctomycetes bacterium]|nr:AAA family ATPase [Planctomycetota bacterium]